MASWKSKLEDALLRPFPDPVFIKIQYRLRLKKLPDLRHPHTFNEKINWLKLHDRRPEYSVMADKYAAKQWIADAIGEEHVIPTLGVWDSYDAIDFDSLPDRFVLKTTHDCGGNKICTDKSKIDHDEYRRFFGEHLARNYYYHAREWPYRSIKPRIMAEMLLEDAETQDLKDYKFFCFNGEAKLFKVDFDRFTRHRANYYAVDGTLLPFGETVCPPDFEKELVLPPRLDDMKALADRFAEGIPFIRIDFYCVGGKIYFGEFTFFPNAGFGSFVPAEWDEKLGEMIHLPCDREK